MNKLFLKINNIECLSTRSIPRKDARFCTLPAHTAKHVRKPPACDATGLRRGATQKRHLKACRAFAAGIAKLLLRSAADINAEDLSGARPLQLARLHNFNDLYIPIN